MLSEMDVSDASFWETSPEFVASPGCIGDHHLHVEALSGYSLVKAEECTCLKEMLHQSLPPWGSDGILVTWENQVTAGPRLGPLLGQELIQRIAEMNSPTHSDEFGREGR